MSKIIATNKQARFNYQFLDSFEAGIVLKGWEVKSIRKNDVSLNNAFVTLKNTEAYIHNLHIKRYMFLKGDPTRTRKLLLHEHQLKKLNRAIKTKGLTIVASKLKWSQSQKIKVIIVLAKSKSKVDKRQEIKQKDIQRKIKNIYNI